MKLKLYELVEMKNEIEQFFEGEELEINMEMFKELVEEKAQNIVAVDRNIAAEIEAIKSEEERLAARRKTLENRYKKFKEYIVGTLSIMEIDKIKTPLGNISIRKSKAVEILDEAAIPVELFREKVTREVNKSVIKEMLQSGQEVAGAVLKENHGLSIR